MPASEEAFHIPDAIPTGKFKEPHHEKKHTEEGADATNEGSKTHEAGMEEVTEQKVGYWTPLPCKVYLRLKYMTC